MDDVRIIEFRAMSSVKTKHLGHGVKTESARRLRAIGQLTKREKEKADVREKWEKMNK